MMENRDLDNRIIREFGRYPETEIPVGTRWKIMERVHEYRRKKDRAEIFADAFFKCSAAFLAVSVMFLIFTVSFSFIKEKKMIIQYAFIKTLFVNETIR